MQFKQNLWAVIIGASGGIGYAAAEKLAAHGMNLCLIHRDRRGAMPVITEKFDELKKKGVQVMSLNCDALSEEGRKTVLDRLQETMGKDGCVRMILHALALGNLKLLAPLPVPRTSNVFSKLSEKLGCSEDRLKEAFSEMCDEDEPGFYPFIEPAYPDDGHLSEDDFRHTVHAMGTNIYEWVKDLFDRNMFADDARVLTLTSEGNSIAWRGYAAVSAAKAVLESLSRSMAVEFGPYGIRSNVIQAGVTDTAALRMIPGNERIRANALMRNPMGRLTRPEDVADVIYLLTRDEAAWINGALICADGGERIG